MQFRPPAIAHDAIEIRRFSLIVYTLIGASMLWTFGDTLMTVTGADGFNYRSSTGAWGAPGQRALDDALDAAGAPYQLLPYSAFGFYRGVSSRPRPWESTNPTRHPPNPLAPPRINWSSYQCQRTVVSN